MLGGNRIRKANILKVVVGSWPCLTGSRQPVIVFY